jgi:hypothetical protein
LCNKVIKIKKKTETPGATFNSAMADSGFREYVLSLPTLDKKELWVLSKKFFNYLE